VITWKDFIFDEVIGPYLDVDLSCRKAKLGDPCIREDATGKKETPESVSIQETGQEQRPARMVGLSSSEDTQSAMEGGRDNRDLLRRRRVE